MQTSFASFTQQAFSQSIAFSRFWLTDCEHVLSFFFWTLISTFFSIVIQAIDELHNNFGPLKWGIVARAAIEVFAIRCKNGVRKVVFAGLCDFSKINFCPILKPSKSLQKHFHQLNEDRFFGRIQQERAPYRSLKVSQRICVWLEKTRKRREGKDRNRGREGEREQKIQMHVWR